MEKKKIKDLAKGEYFILNSIEEPNASQVWVRGEYIREAKKYSTSKQEGYLPTEAKEAFEENGIPF